MTENFEIHQKIMRRVASKSGKTIYRKRRIGDLVAIRVEDQVAFGYSLLHKNDRYNIGEDGNHVPNLGVTKAKTRAFRWLRDDIIEIPPSIEKDVNKFMERCQKYFKDVKLPQVGVMHVDYPTTKRIPR